MELNVTEDARLNQSRAPGSLPAISLSFYNYTGYLFLLILPLMSVILSIDLFTLIAMARTKRIPLATKLLTCFALGCDCMFVSILFMVYFSILLQGGPVWLAMLTELARLVATLSWVAVTLMLLDRVICFCYPVRYAIIATSRNILVSMVVVMASVAIVKTTMRYLILPVARGEAFNFIIQTANDENIMMTVLGGCISIGIVCYIIIFGIVRKHIRHTCNEQMRPFQALRAYTSIKSVSVVFAVFLFVHVPLLLVWIWKNTLNNANSLRFVILVTMFIVIIVNPFLYAWRFRECRYIMVRGLATVCGSFEAKAERMRHEVYNIVPGNMGTLSLIRTRNETSGNRTL